MKYNTKYGVIWFAIMLPLNAIIGVFSTMIGIITLLAGDTLLWYCLPIGLFCLFNIKVYFELAQNLTREELREMILEDSRNNKKYLNNK